MTIPLGRLQERQIEERVLPVGRSPEDMPGSILKPGDGSETRMFRVFNIQSLAALGTVTFDVETEPDYWLVKVFARSGSLARVYLEATAAGEFIPLGSGGSAKLPGRGQYLTVQNVSAQQTLDMTIVALRGLDGDFSSGEVDELAPSSGEAVDNAILLDGSVEFTNGAPLGTEINVDVSDVADGEVLTNFFMVLQNTGGQQVSVRRESLETFNAVPVWRTLGTTTLAANSSADITGQAGWLGSGEQRRMRFTLDALATSTFRVYYRIRRR